MKSDPYLDMMLGITPVNKINGISSCDINDFERIIQRLDVEIQDAKDNPYDDESETKGFINGLEMAIGIVKDCWNETT